MCFGSVRWRVQQSASREAAADRAQTTIDARRTGIRLGDSLSRRTATPVRSPAMNCVSHKPHGATPSALATYLLLVAVLPVSGACQRPQERPAERPLSREQQAKWTHDSAGYLTDSAKWVRDSIVRDSISRTINTDVLFRDSHRMLAAPDPNAVIGDVDCDRSRILWRYGAIPGEMAIRRMEDTVWKEADASAVRAMNVKLDHATLAQQEAFGRRLCGDRGTMQPQFLKGTNLDGMGGRPARPVRP